MQHWGWPARGQGGFPPDRGYIKKDKGQGRGECRCRDKFLPAVKFFPPPVTLPSVLSAVCIAQN